MVADILGVHAVGAIVLLGMAGYFAGVVQAPITSFVIIGEMSGATGMVIPLMLSSFIGYGISRLFMRQSLYHALAANFLRDAKKLSRFPERITTRPPAMTSAPPASTGRLGMVRKVMKFTTCQTTNRVAI